MFIIKKHMVEIVCSGEVADRDKRLVGIANCTNM
jgi:hypothetical protein